MPFLRCKDDCGKQALYECTRCRAPLCEDAAKPRFDEAEFSPFEVAIAIDAFTNSRSIVCYDCRHNDAVAGVDKIRRHKWPSNQFELALEVLCLGIDLNMSYFKGELYYAPYSRFNIKQIAREWARYALANDLEKDEFEVAGKIIQGRKGFLGRRTRVSAQLVYGWYFENCFHTTDYHLSYQEPTGKLHDVAIDENGILYINQELDGLDQEVLTPIDLCHNNDQYNSQGLSLFYDMAPLYANIRNITCVKLPRR